MTDIEIKNAKSKEKDYFLSDMKGLRLLVHRSGAKYFQFRYSYQKKQKIVSIGPYPIFSLLEARQKALDYQKLLANGKDPQFLKRQAQIESVGDIEAQVHKIYEKWLLVQSKKVKEGTLKRDRRFFEKHLLPYLSEYDKDGSIITSKDISDITHKSIIDIILEYEKSKGSDLARRFFSNVKNVWRYAFNIGVLKNNPLSNIVHSEILAPAPKNHYPKITDEAILGELLRAIESYKGSILIGTALQFVALVPLRAGNLAKLKWDYINWDKKTLKIPRNEMKVSNKNFPDFELPLSNQAIGVLKKIRVFTGHSEWVFHSVQDHRKHLVSESLSKALKSMGFNDEKRGRKQLVHSFRGTFRSLCDTYQHEHNAHFEVKEAVLDHHVGNNVTQAYSHKSDYTEQMRPLLQWWADFLDRVKAK